MAGRALAFSDPEIVRMAKEDYVPVACDDWYQRRRQDAEGEFFRDVSDQGPRGHQNATRQGIYLLTADGQLLGWKNAGQNPRVMREFMKEGLAKWNALPPDRRCPGAVKVPDAGDLDGGYDRKPPRNGLIVNVHARALERTELPGAAGVSDAVCKIGNGDEASRDHLWITEAEWRSLLPASGAKKGDSFPLVPSIARRIARFHLIDNTRGEPPMWRAEDVRKCELTLTVERADAEKLVLRLEGLVFLATDADRDRAGRGYDASLLGYLGFDRTRDCVERFDVVALGDHWGEGTFTRGARPGRTPLGVAFELAADDKPGDAVPPQAAREINAYLNP